MSNKTLLKKIDILRDRYTWDKDKQELVDLAKKVRMDSLKLGLAEQKPMLELIAFLEEKVDDITFLLSWDEKMVTMSEERNKLFIKRESYLDLLSFFTDAKKRIKTITSRVNSELNEHS